MCAMPARLTLSENGREWVAERSGATTRSWVGVLSADSAPSEEQCLEMYEAAKEIETGPDTEQPRRCMASTGIEALTEQLGLGQGDRLAVLGHSIQRIINALASHVAPQPLLAFDLDPQPASTALKEQVTRVASVSGARDIIEASHVLLASPLADVDLIELLHLESQHPERRIATVRPIPSWVRDLHPACHTNSLEGSSHLQLVKVALPEQVDSMLWVYKMSSCGPPRDRPSDDSTVDNKLRQDRLAALRRQLDLGPESPPGGLASVSSGKSDPKSLKDLLRVVFFSLSYTVGILCFLVLAALVLDGLMDNSIVNYITATIDPRFLGQCALAGLMVLAMVAVVDEGIYQAPTAAGIPSPKALLFQTAAMASVLLGLLLMMAFANNSVGAALTMA